VIRWVGQQSEAARVFDLGTGSGAIALSIAQETSASVVASDASADAIAVAQANAQRLDLNSRVEFRHAALFDAFGVNERFDVLVSNPPYVADHERDALAPEVRDWEPEQALFAGADGLNLIRQLVSGAPERLRPSGLLALEIGAQQTAAVRELLAESGCYANIQTHKDLAGRDRVVLAETRER
jgi:release factor glutamine methyltransferase